MTKSHAGYRIPPSQMDNMPIDNLQSKHFSKSTPHYVKVPEKSDIRYQHVINHLDFFKRYKITVFSAIVSIMALIFFSASIIYLALQSAADNFPSLSIEKIIEGKPITEYKILNENDYKEIGRRERPMSEQIYEIVSESSRRMEKREIRKIKKRQTPEIYELNNDENFFVGNRRLRRIETGSKITGEIEKISDDDKFFREMYKDYDENRNNEKREIERRKRLNTCRRNVDHCKSVVETMQSLVKTTTDNLESLTELINQIKIEKGNSEMDTKFEDFLQCVECKKTFNDSIKFIDGSKTNETNTLNENNFHHHEENSHMKSFSSITALLNNPSSLASEVTEKISKIEETKSSSFPNVIETSTPSSNKKKLDGNVEKRVQVSKIEETKSFSFPNVSETSTPSSNKKKFDGNVEKRVQVSKSKKITDGVEVTEIIRNTTIYKQQTDEGSPKDVPKDEIPSVNFVKNESSMRPSMDFNSLTPLHGKSTIQVKDSPKVSTGSPPISKLPGLTKDSSQDSSGWTETTGAQTILKELPGTSTIAPVKDKSGQGRSPEEGTVAPVKDKSVQGRSQEDETIAPVKDKSGQGRIQEEGTIAPVKDKSAEGQSQEDGTIAPVKDESGQGQSREEETIVPVKDKSGQGQSREEETIVPVKDKSGQGQSREEETIVPVKDKSGQGQSREEETIVPVKDKSAEGQSQEDGTIAPAKDKFGQGQSPEEGTIAPAKVKSAQGWNQEDGTMAVPFEPRIMTGSQPEQNKINYDGNSILLPTAETMKTSQQVQYTPSVSWIPYPVCFLGSPNSGTPTGPLGQSMPGIMPFPVTSPGTGNYPFPGNQFPQRGYGFSGQPSGQGFGHGQYQQQTVQFQNGQQFQHGSFPMGYQQGLRVGPTGPGVQNFVPNFVNPPTAPGQTARSPYYCTYMSAPTFQFPMIPGITEFQRSVDDTGEMVGGTGKTFPEPAWNVQGPFSPGYGEECGRDSHRCDDGNLCIVKTSWCDGKIDCPDASDETKCSCSDRINKDRICDGYFDCPRGEDELGCFGCPKDNFSCQDWTRSQRRGSCVPLSERCDGTQQCPNGKDEMDCSILTQSYIENQDVFTVGYTTGYLHKNYQGRWYPVCTPTESWAMDACLAETGSPTREPPRIQIESTPPGHYQVSYLAQSPTGEIKILSTCYEKAIYVRCPEIPCGTRILSDLENENPNDNSPYDQGYEDSLVASTKKSKSSRNETRRDVKKIEHGMEKVSERLEDTLDDSKSFGAKNGTDLDIVNSELRVVGGRASQPKAWPFLVAIYKDGLFHCGGAIVNEEWILTAAHCVHGFQTHYYEIQAGLLRRFSFSPMAQTRRASYIKMHPSYERNIMKNDLALIRLNEPLLFNRWIRPTCLPKSWRSETYWKNWPLPDTTCVTIGWGATTEHGPDPDHLREVEVPILPECKHQEDRNDAEICAGIPQGGRDACQGDSGGPLMCNYPDSADQWYVAGIVSHGEGCGRPDEPGAYTKVSHFVDWIDEIIRTREIIMIGPKPRTTCPGFSCAGGLGKCLPSNRRCDRTVNCLDAEDEINCGSHKNFAFFQGATVARDNQRSILITPEIKSREASMKNLTTNSSSVDNFNVTTSGKTAKLSVFTMDNDENSTTTKMETVTTTSSTPFTTLENGTEFILMNFTSSQEQTTTTSKPQSSQNLNKNFVMLRFTCERLIQSLPMSKRCDRVIDCEDGTDEDNCTCKDYLTNFYPKAICDGHVDCDDESDEENCAFCKDDEFVCRRSGKCVQLSKICDHNVDCPGMEDELDCFSLTNGNYVIIDKDKRPHLNLEGVVTQWNNGTWRPTCKKFSIVARARLANNFCHYFGFGSAQSVDEITVRNSSMEIKESTKNYSIPYEYPQSYESLDESNETCRGLYVRCKPVLSANTSHLIITDPKTENLRYLWPWQASVFVNDLYQCPAILLEHSWLLASARCVEKLDLAENYTMALLGTTPTYLYVDGPYQQTAPIDSIKISKKWDAALLHLEYPVNMTRYVQPIFVEKKIFPPTKKDVCVATGVDEKYHTKTIFLQPVTEKCPQCYRCYRNATFEDCKNETSTNWSGTIVCRGSGTWYPAAVFHEKDMLCDFQSVQTVTSIDYGNAHLMQMMDEDLESIERPKCDGVRCPLGKCVTWDKVCDGIDDCRDGSDENILYCEKKKELCETTNEIHCECSKSELRCANGQCVPKEAFCDYKIDCDDRSDETPSCTCADYLRLTAPERLCNNVRDCLDKSDESSENCPCEATSFECSGNGTESCVSQDFVCDGEPDCANGEDEKNCRMIKGTLNDPPGTGQVLRRSFGVWYPECFSSPVTSTKQISDLCKSMGYNFGNALNVNEDENIYGRALIPMRDDFYIIRMNKQTWITTRKNRPLVTLVEPRETCHRVFLKCSSL